MLALLVWLARRRLARPVLLATGSAALIGTGMFLFAGAVMPFAAGHEKLRPIAHEIDDTVPPGTRLCVYDPDYQPSLYYLRTPFFYAPTMDEIPAGQPWLITREEKRSKLLKEHPEYAIIRQFPEKRPELLLMQAKSARRP
jgi:hypothetical protein